MLETISELDRAIRQEKQHSNELMGLEEDLLDDIKLMEGKEE